jgi:AcrR family transcriptional regulator
MIWGETQSLGEIRDAERTRNAILQAAIQEFSEKGYYGARVESIAKRAGLSKQLLYHYFPNKDGLLKHALEQLAVPFALPASSAPPQLGSLLKDRFLANLQQVDYLRFSTWEAVEADKGDIIAQEKRQWVIDKVIESMLLMQQGGKIPKHLDARLLLLAAHSLTVYPLVFWQVTHMMTGMYPDEPAFQHEWGAFLDRLEQQLLQNDSEA